MLNGREDGVEEHKNDDKPIKRLRLDGTTYPKPESFFDSPEL
jgi:hypothetical protein